MNCTCTVCKCGPKRCVVPVRLGHRAEQQAQDEAAALFHEWARLPGYEAISEEMAITLIIKIRDLLLIERARA